MQRAISVATVLSIMVISEGTHAAIDPAPNTTDRNDVPAFHWECKPDSHNLRCWRNHRCQTELLENVPEGTRIGRIPVTADAGLRYEILTWSPTPFIVEQRYLTAKGDLDRELRNAYYFTVRAYNDTFRLHINKVCEEIQVVLKVLDVDETPHAIECPTGMEILAHSTPDDGMRWTFIVGDEDLAVPALHTFLEGPDARFARLSSARNLYALDGQPYALIDYDIIIISEDVDRKHTSVCKVLLWDPQFVASSLFELMTMTLKFTMTPAFDTRPRFSHCPPALQASGEHFSADEELMMVAAEAYLSPPNVRLVDRRLKLFAQNEPECTLNWYCVNYLIVNGRRPLNIAALGKFEITLSLTADFGGTNATECRIVLIAKSRSGVLSECNATEAAASSTSAPSSASSVQTSERTTGLALGLILAVASAAFAVGCVCGHRMRWHGLPLLPTVTWTRDADAFEMGPTRDDASTRTGHMSLSDATDV